MTMIFDADVSRGLTASAETMTLAPIALPERGRAMTAAVSRIRIDRKSAARELDRNSTREIRQRLWTYYDRIGEVKFAFNLMASLMSRIHIYPALVTKRGEVPTRLDFWADEMNKKQRSMSATLLKAAAEQAMMSLERGSGIPGHLRQFTLNASVTGEMFFVGYKGTYHTVSTDEIRKLNNGYVLQQTQEASGVGGIQLPLPPDTYVSRIWRPHGRFSREAESSLMGVKDKCEELLLIDQAIRSTIRSRLNAGALFIPEGVNVATAEDADDEDALEQMLIEAWTTPLTDEGIGSSIIPLLLVGAAELGEKIKHIDVARVLDSGLIDESQRALDRVLSGLDIPKDIVQGLSDVKYSNAIVVDDNLFRAHIEPLILLWVDAYTRIYYRPYLRKAGVPEALVQHSVLWYDPSPVVARPDRSSAANEGFDRAILSEAAWRHARGFSESDAPTAEELVRRKAVEPGQLLTPDVAQALLEYLAPEVFRKIRVAERTQVQMPNDIQEILDGGDGGGTPGQSAPAPGDTYESPPPPSPADQSPSPSRDGGALPQGGTMPPRGPARG